MTLEGRAAMPPGSWASAWRHAVAPSRSAFRFAVWSVAAASAIGCSRETAVDLADAASYGEPIGVDLRGRPPAPPLAIAFAVTRGHDARTMVTSLAGAMEAVERQCPDFDDAISRGWIVRFEMRATATSLEAWGLPAKRGGACVKSVLEGKRLTVDGAAAVDVVLDVRLGSEDASALR